MVQDAYLSAGMNREGLVSGFLTEYLPKAFGVTGCGQRRTYIVICPQGGAGCFAAEGHR
jgi:hypothetical protein